jgi:hypothetical protein
VQVEQRVSSEAGQWDETSEGLDAHAVLVFGGRDIFESTDWLPSLRRLYPRALVVGCSTAGDIAGCDVTDNSIVATAFAFSRGRCVLSKQTLADHSSTSSAATALVRGLPAEGLVHVVVLSDGLSVNGTELIRGLQAALPARVAVTGGLSADAARFERTLVVADAPPQSGVVAALGFYGDALRVGYGSLGGWDPFGPERLITRAEGNVLYELDGTNALDLYRRYLGEHARDLPAAALRFPLRLRGTNGDPGPVRTILGIDEERGSMRFAGEMPRGGHARLMKANFERLIDGANGAATQGVERLGGPAELALLISCVGRRLVLGQRVDEELDSVREVVGPSAVMAGFYSYGEICPVAAHAGCELHNQTMTITTLREI